jgi:septum formation topological specificity factor MinE
MSLEVLSSSDRLEFREKLLDVIQKYKVNIKKGAMTMAQVYATEHERPRISVVIDGPTLALAFEDMHCADALF